jgi:hypothetical protein
MSRKALGRCPRARAVPAATARHRLPVADPPAWAQPAPGGAVDSVAARGLTASTSELDLQDVVEPE